MPYHYSTTSD